MTKTADQIEKMRIAGQILAGILQQLKFAAQPGMTTLELDTMAANLCRKEKVRAAFLGYEGYPYSLCASVNEAVVHGMPTHRILQTNDLLSLDFGVVYEGWYADSAISFTLGQAPGAVQNLLKVTQAARDHGIAQCRPGNHIGDIGAAIEAYVESQGLQLVKEYAGHGIGQALHEEPIVPHFRSAIPGLELREGMVLAIEPIVTLGSSSIEILDDGWTAVTVDGSPAAHFEHTVVVTAHGPEVLTALNP